jgi:hypothetical protein
MIEQEWTFFVQTIEQNAGIGSTKMISLEKIKSVGGRK